MRIGETAPTVTAPSGVQTTLSYSASPSTVCTVNTSTGALTLADMGECEITATAAGTDNYNEATATYTVTVRDAEDDAPVAVNDQATVVMGGSVEIDVTANDTDLDDMVPDDVTVSVVSAPSNGTATVNADKSITYVHDGSAATMDSFTYKLNDGVSDSNIATVTIDVTVLNNPPIAMNHSVSTLVNEPVQIDLLPLASDVDGDELFYEVQAAEHGTVSLNGTTATYTPPLDFAGVDTFEYVISDGQGGVAVGMVEISVAILTIAAQRIVPVNIRQVAGPMADDVALTRQLTGVRGLFALASPRNFAGVPSAGNAAPKTGWVIGTEDGSPYYFGGSNEAPVFEMDLGGLFTLRSLQVGGAPEGTDPGSEAASFHLEFSTDGGATYSGQVEQVETTGLLGSRREELPLASETIANWVRMTVTDNAYGRGFADASGGDRVHLGEVAFGRLRRVFNRCRSCFPRTSCKRPQMARRRRIF